MRKFLLIGILVLGMNALGNDLGQKTLVVKNELKTTSANYISGKKEAIKRISAIFNYAEDNAYEIYTKPDFITTIKLEANEDILYIAGGNTEGFMIDQTRGGKDGSSLIYIKPLFEDLDTNMIITTDKRVYYFNVRTSKTIFNPMVRFMYPLEREIVAYANDIEIAKIESMKEEESLTRTEIKEKELEHKAQIPTNNITDLKYQVLDHNVLTPDLVYNDGVKTYVRLRKGIAELPILEVIGEDGKAERVNMRVEEEDGYKFFIVDKIFNQGQLKAGNLTARFIKIN